MTWDLRIAVCVPGERWLAGFGQCAANMLRTFSEAQYAGGSKTCELFAVSGSMLPDVRMRCVAEALKWGATHLLFLDDDMLLPWDTINVLLRHNLPIVAANYPRREPEARPTAQRLDGTPLFTEPGDAGLVEVAHAGTGCMLIDMRVFDALDLPYFAFTIAENGVGTVGEDVYFCRKAREAGFKIYVDQQLSNGVSHIGMIPHTHAMSLAGRALAQGA